MKTPFSILSNYLLYNSGLYRSLQGVVLLVFVGSISVQAQLAEVTLPAGYTSLVNGSNFTIGSDVYLGFRGADNNADLVKYDGTTYTTIPTPAGFNANAYGGYNPVAPLVVGSVAYVRYTRDSDNSYALFKFDGTTLTEITSPAGFTGNSYGYVGNPIAAGSNVYFRFRAADNDFYLMKYDGSSLTQIANTAGGTYTTYNDRGYYGGPFTIGANLFLQYYNDAGSFPLLKYDGTTLSAITLPAGYTSSARGYQGVSIEFGSDVYLQFRNDDFDWNLVKMDGTTFALTVIDNPVGYDGFNLGYRGTEPIVVGSDLYMQYFNASFNGVLMKYDGTSFTAIESPSGFTGANQKGYVGSPIVVGTDLFLRYRSDSDIYHLAKYDGTSLSIVDNPAGFTAAYEGYTGYPVAIGSDLYLRYTSGGFSEVWSLVKYNGSTLTAYPNPAGYTGSYQGLNTNPFVIGSDYYNGLSGDNGVRLFKYAPDVTAPTFTSLATANYTENGTGVAYSASADETVTFTLGSSKDESLFGLANANEISFSSSPDYENPSDGNTDNDYVIDVIATDAAGNATTQTVTITVTDADEIAPTFTSSATSNYQENGTGVAYIAGADETVTFTLGNAKDESLFSLANDNEISFSASPDFETPADGNADNEYVIDVIATDGVGNSTILEVTISVTDAQQISTLSSSANGEASIIHQYDEFFEETMYNARGIRFTTGASATVLSSFTALLVAGEPVGDVEAIVYPDNGSGFPNTAIVSGTLLPTVSTIPSGGLTEFTGNIALDAGSSYFVTLQRPIQTAMGVQSRWKFANTDPNTVVETDDGFTVAPGNIYEVQSQGGTWQKFFTGGSFAYSLKAEVDVTSPTFTSAATANYEENGTGVAYSATADETVTFTLGNAKDESLFSLANDNEINFNTSPNYENPTDGNTDNDYVIDVIATDVAGNATFLEVTITVTDADEIAPTFTSSATSNYQENGTGVAYIAGADETVTFTLGNTKDELLFSLANDNEISFSTSPDFETPADGNTDNDYVIDVIATDLAGNATILEVTITVTDADEITPTFTSSATSNYQENGTGVAYIAGADETVTFTLGNTKDELLFSLANDNEISFSTSPDFETPADGNADNEYVIDVIATDGSGNATTLEVTITVTDADEIAPTFTSSATSNYQENGTGVAYTAGADETVTFTLGNTKDELLFSLANDNEISFSASPDFETPADGNADNGYVLDVIATDAAGNSTTLEVTISVTDVFDIVINFNGLSFSGENYVSTENSNIQFSMNGNFSISNDKLNFSGASYSADDYLRVETVDGSNLDFQSFYVDAQFYSVESVEAYDNGVLLYTFDAPSSGDAAGIISLGDEFDDIDRIDLRASENGFYGSFDNFVFGQAIDNTSPTFTSAITASFEENGTGVAYTATADETVTFTLGLSKDESLFSLANDNEISFSASPDFETPLDGTDGVDRDNDYLIDVIATDGAGNATTLEVTISVTDVDDVAPIFDTAPVVSNTTSVGFDLDASIDEAGDIYYVVLADGATAPSSEEVIAGTGNAGTLVVFSGNAIALTDPFTIADAITSLSENTSYDVYVVARDAAYTPNIQATPTKIEVTTLIAPGTEATVTFEIETDAATSFLSNCQIFTLSGTQFSVTDSRNFGQGGGGNAGSDVYVDNAGAGGSGSGFYTKISSDTDFRAKNLALFLNDAFFSGSYSGSLTITGLNNEATVFTLTSFGGLSAGSFNTIDFSTQDGVDNSNTPIDELVFTATGDLEYIAIDDFTWESMEVISIPVINVKGNNVSIANGDDSPTSSDDTDFGNSSVNQDNTHTFTIENLGSETLTIQSLSVPGVDKFDFEFANVPSSIAANSTATFDITFNPSSSGVKNAYVRLKSDDCVNGTYEFHLKGTGFNDAPTFTSQPVTSLDEGSNYSYAITINDVNGDEVSVTATTKPNWLSLSTTGGTTTSTIAGSGSTGNANGTGTAASFNQPQDVAVDAQGNLYVTDFINFSIRKITPEGVVSSFAGGGKGAADGTGAQAAFRWVARIVVDSQNNIFVTDVESHTVRKITPDAVVTTFAGLINDPGTVDGTGTNARFNYPYGLAIDGNDNLYVVSQIAGELIRKVTPQGVVTSIANTAILSSSNFGVDGRMGIVADQSGDLYVTASSLSKIFKVDVSEETVTEINTAFKGNDLEISSSNELYITDGDNGIWSMLPGGTPSLIAGGSTGSMDGESATFDKPVGLGFNSAGTGLYIIDHNNHKVRKLSILPETTSLVGDATGQAGDHDIVLTANDGAGKTTTQEFTITVNDVTAPTITSGATADYAENGMGVAYTIVATDANAVTYSLGTGNDESLFNITAGAVTFKNAPDFETPGGNNADNTYVINVIASDGTNSVNQDVTITVTDVDEIDPVFTSATAVDFAENGTGTAYTIIATDANAVTYSLGTGNDESLFNITAGAVKFKNAPDFETPGGNNADNTYVINVIASDGTNSVNQDVTITVTDIIAPTFSNLGGTSTYVLGAIEASFAMIPFLDQDVTVTDIELDNVGDYQGASITLQKDGIGSVNDDFRISGDYYQDSGDVVHFSDGAVATYDDSTPGTFIVNFSQASTSKSVVNAIIQGLGYFDKAGPSSQTINYTFNDGAGESVTGSVIVNTVLPSFTGATDADWSDATNWNGNFVPDHTHNVEIEDVANDPIITGTVSVNNIELHTGAKLTVNSGAALAIMGVVTGDGEAIIKRKTNADLGYSIIGSPITDATIVGLGADVIFDFDGTDWTVPTGTMTPGKGYFAAFNDAAPEVVFTGTPNTGAINKSVALGGDNFNIVANPYAAAISRADFIAANGSGVIDGNVWLWDDGGSNVGGDRGGDYIAVNNVGTTSTVDLGDGVAGSETSAAFNGNIGSVQGFLVLATSNANISFTPTMQVTTSGGNDDANHFRTGDIQKLRLSLEGNGLYSDILIALAEGATEGKDYALDAEKYSGNNLMSFYSTQEDKRYAIQTLPHVISESREVKLGMELGESAIYTLEAQDMENMDGLTLMLNDKLTGEQTIMTKGSTVTFTASTGSISDRFSLTFMNDVLGEEARSNTSLKVYKQVRGLMIQYPSRDIEEIGIYTLSGQLVHRENVQFRSGEGIIDAQQLSIDQLYILRVNNQSIKFILK